MLNAYWEPLTFELPPVSDDQQPWRRWIDTALASPDDIRALDEATIITQSSYVVQPRSSVFLALWLKSARETVSHGADPMTMQPLAGEPVSEDISVEHLRRIEEQATQLLISGTVPGLKG
jgi:hypothetical protein